MASSTTMAPHCLILIFISTILYMTSLSCSATQLSYADHCATIVPKSPPTSLKLPTSTFPGFQNGYYRSSDEILNPNFLKNLWFRTQNVYQTDVEGVFKVQGSVTLQIPPNMYSFLQNYTRGQPNSCRSRLDLLSFRFEGYWSESSGKLCMVGSGSAYSKEGNLLHLGSVFKLNYVKNSSIVTSLVTGTLESLSSAGDSNYFEPISVFGFIELNYKYTLVSEEIDNGSSGGSDIPQSVPLNSLCWILLRPWNGFELKYASNCDSFKNCTPFGGSMGYLPPTMSFNTIQCSEDNQRLQVLVEFHNSSYVGRQSNPNTVLVGEGLWDGKKNQLCIVACPILNTTDSLANAHVGHCSIRLSFVFPAIWSIRDGNSIVGQIWSNKSVNDSGYFDRIMYRSSRNPMEGVLPLKYEYTEIDRVQTLCLQGKKPVKNKGDRYSNGYSYAMRFSGSVKNSKGEQGWVYSVPVSVGDLVYKHNQEPMLLSSSMLPANSSNGSLLNISYKMDFTLLPGVKLGGGISPIGISSNSLNMREEISAEGIYDAETGSLCMVGCRHLGPNNWTSTNDAMDCEILVNFQFSQSNSKNNEGSTKGSIKSTRKKYDPLYFERLDLSSTTFVMAPARQSIWKMNFEITMILISNTLACVFVGLQLFYVKKHPDMLLFTSLVMLGILTLGYMIPLLLNFQALFLQNHIQQNVLLGSEAIARFITVVAFLFQFRLLQLTWLAQLGNGRSQKELWAAEKKALNVSLQLYVAGALIALSVNRKKNSNGLGMISSLPIGNYRWHSLQGDLKSCRVLVLDGFLLPQILLNIFRNSREKPLSCSFYIGTTLVRLIPHVFYIYRAHSHVSYFLGSHTDINPRADFYSIAWDLIIPCGGFLFATIIYLQQRFGASCILPQRFRQLEVYENVPLVSDK